MPERSGVPQPDDDGPPGQLVGRAAQKLPEAAFDVVEGDREGGERRCWSDRGLRPLQGACTERINGKDVGRIQIQDEAQVVEDGRERHSVVGRVPGHGDDVGQEVRAEVGGRAWREERSRTTDATWPSDVAWDHRWEGSSDATSSPHRTEQALRDVVVRARRAVTTAAWT